ncbi:MAG: recombinase RecT [Saprospiraceae bacterium]|nr:recombinase RecT [Saprospiraceae bacterium]
MSNLQQSATNNPPPTITIKNLMSGDSVKNKFEEILGKNANAFISSVTTLATTTSLRDCDPMSVLTCAITAATLNLQVNQTLGQAYIIPYKGKNGLVAQFQLGWKGYLALAMRTGQFKRINVSPVYEGQFKNHDIVTGDMDFTGEKKSDKVVGYVSFFRLQNDFEKTLYMTVEEVRKHGEKYSKSFSFQGSVWATNFDAMAQKTVLKLLLSRYAPLSVELQTAVLADQSVIKPTSDDSLDFSSYEYVDNSDDNFKPVDKNFDATPTQKSDLKPDKSFENEAPKPANGKLM